MKILTAVLIIGVAGCSTPAAPKPTPTIGAEASAYEQGRGTRNYFVLTNQTYPTAQECSDLYPTSVSNGTKEDFMNGCLGG